MHERSMHVYSLSPTTDLFIGPYRGLYKEGVNLSPELVALSRFQTAKFETDLWQQFQFACFQKLPKVETFIYQKIAKT